MVSESVSWPVSMMIGALKPFLRRMRTASRPSMSGKPQIDLSRLGSLHALIAVLSRDGFILLVQRKLLRQRAAQFGIILDNQNLTRIRHRFRPPQPLGPIRRYSDGALRINRPAPVRGQDGFC